MELCFGVAGLVLLRLAGAATLAWTHSVGHVRIEEEYSVRNGVLALAEVRVEGPAAGVDVPPHSRFDGRWWRHIPAAAPREVVLANSGHAAGYTLCHRGDCRPLAAWLGVAGQPVRLHACGAVRP